MHLVTKITWGEFKRWVDSHIESGEISEDSLIETVSFGVADPQYHPEGEQLEIDDLIILADEQKSEFMIVSKMSAFKASPRMRQDAIAQAEAAGDHEAATALREADAELSAQSLVRQANAIVRQATQ